MPLGTKVGLSPGDSVLDKDPAQPSQKGDGTRGPGAEPPNFRTMSVVAKRLDGSLGMEVGLGPVHIVLDGNTAPLHKKGAEPNPKFLAHLWLGASRYNMVRR